MVTLHCRAQLRRLTICWKWNLEFLLPFVVLAKPIQNGHRKIRRAPKQIKFPCQPCVVREVITTMFILSFKLSISPLITPTRHDHVLMFCTFVLFLFFFSFYHQVTVKMLSIPWQTMVMLELDAAQRQTLEWRRVKF